MKKVLYSFAAMAFALTFTACGSKTEGTDNAADSAKQEEAPAAEAQASVREMENEDLSVTCPEGWTIEKGSFGRIEMEDVNSTEAFKPKIKVSVIKDKTMKEKMDYYISGETKAGADYTAGGYTFKTARNESSELYYCLAELEGGKLLQLETVYIAPEADVVKPVVESIKLK